MDATPSFWASLFWWRMERRRPSEEESATPRRGADEPQAPPFRPGDAVLAVYKWTGAWRAGRVRSVDPDGSLTVKWESDGFLQVGTRGDDMKRGNPSLLAHSRGLTVGREKTPAVCEEARPTTSGEEKKEEAAAAAGAAAAASVWTCAKRGDIAGTIAWIDGGFVGPNDPEPLVLDGRQHAGRSPLYWACFGGHVDLVEALIDRGGLDEDRTCFIAVTSSERANDERDLLFDPDSNVFSDFIDHAEEVVGGPIGGGGGGGGGASASAAKIRGLLLKAAAANATAAAGGGDRRYEPLEVCCACSEARAAARSQPCGHVACCLTCLTRLRDLHQPCPLCRARIRTILQIQVQQEPLLLSTTGSDVG